MFTVKLIINNVFQLFCADCHIIAVCVHLNQFEISSVKIPVKKVIIEFKHSKLCQLIYSYSYLKWSSDCDPRFSAFQLISLSDLVKITEICASKGSVDYLLVFGVNDVCLPLQGFDELPVPAIS